LFCFILYFILIRLFGIVPSLLWYLAFTFTFIIISVNYLLKRTHIKLLSTKCISFFFALCRTKQCFIHSLITVYQYEYISRTVIKVMPKFHSKQLYFPVPNFPSGYKLARNIITYHADIQIHTNLLN